MPRQLVCIFLNSNSIGVLVSFPIKEKAYSGIIKRHKINVGYVRKTVYLC
jgi:hypothetical protein